MRRNDSSLLVLLLAGLLSACADAPKSTTPVTPPPASAQPSGAASGGSSTIAVGHGSSAPAASAPAAGAPSDALPAADGGNAGGVKWSAPRRWKLGPERPMRAATYMVPAAAGDSEGAECAVFFFGPGQGGSVQANIDRWIGQFEQPDGRPSAQLAKQNQETINGIPVTTIDLTGTYAGGGPMMGSSGGKKAGYRLLGAIVEGPQGVVFFKMTGPAATVAAAQQEFQAMLKSLGT